MDRSEPSPKARASAPGSASGSCWLRERLDRAGAEGASQFTSRREATGVPVMVPPTLGDQTRLSVA